MFPVRVSTRQNREKKLYAFCKRTQYYGVDITVLRKLRGSPLRDDFIDGIQHRVRRGIDVVVRGRNSRTETQGIVGFTGQYSAQDRIVIHVCHGFVFRLENGGSVEYIQSDNLYMPHHFRVYCRFQCFPLKQ